MTLNKEENIKGKGINIIWIINKMFNQEIEERIKMKEKNEDYPF